MRKYEFGNRPTTGEFLGKLVRVSQKVRRIEDRLDTPVCGAHSFMKAFSLVACLSLLVSPMAYPDESEERSKINDTVSVLLKAEDFAALEKIAASYRSEEERTSSGILKLAEFYAGMNATAVSSAEEGQAGWDRVIAIIESWIKKYPDSPTPYVAKGTALMNRGWDARGEGWASSVSRQNVERFRQYSIEAATFLIENAEVGSADPHWFQALANAYMALGAGKDDFMALVDAGLERFPNYDPLYFRTAAYLSPKWHGSLAELESFAQAAVARTRAIRGYELYARIYWAGGLANKQLFAFQGSEAVWEDMVRGMDDVVRKYPDQWNINHFAYFACYKGDMETTRRFLELVEEPVSAESWGGHVMNYQKCRLNAGLNPSPNIALPER